MHLYLKYQSSSTFGSKDMHLYLKYQSPNKFGSKDIAQVKVFQNYVKVQDQGHKVKSFDTIGKVSS
jgi:hypothetical protein